ncbi:cytochrome c oxidase assembly protein [Novispirillum sp. DQ9]|uniref:cytochrome c oxidase assembly protein n=1 Tax=Novispirillum sp. DQ9 TaxID=3398612 RepID=UPI003C79EEC4
MARASNARLGLIAAAFAVGMVGLAFAAVPAYQLFCKVTGYGGTPAIGTAGAAAPAVLDRAMTVRFDASINGTLPWRFAPAQGAVTLKVGEQGLAFYQATNTSGEAITGTATFNVTPLKAAKYFTKIDCFCFTEQTLAPGQTVDMPVTFYIDPAIADDPHVAEVGTITLSYTFFRKEGGRDGGNS